MVKKTENKHDGDGRNNGPGRKGWTLFKPRQKEKVMWEENLAVVIDAKDDQLKIRSYFKSSSDGTSMWDQPPKGASTVRYASNEAQKMAECQMFQMQVTTCKKERHQSSTNMNDSRISEKETKRISYKPTAEFIKKEKNSGRKKNREKYKKELQRVIKISKNDTVEGVPTAVIAKPQSQIDCREANHGRIDMAKINTGGNRTQATMLRPNHHIPAQGIQKSQLRPSSKHSNAHLDSTRTPPLSERERRDSLKSQQSYETTQQKNLTIIPHETDIIYEEENEEEIQDDAFTKFTSISIEDQTYVSKITTSSKAKVECEVSTRTPPLSERERRDSLKSQQSYETTQQQNLTIIPYETDIIYEEGNEEEIQDDAFTKFTSISIQDQTYVSKITTSSKAKVEGEVLKTKSYDTRIRRNPSSNTSSRYISNQSGDDDDAMGVMLLNAYDSIIYEEK